LPKFLYKLWQSLFFTHNSLSFLQEVEVRLLDKPYDKDVQVSFAYDASAYDKVKADYSGFELGDANLVQLSEATKTLSKGETSVTFTLTISNNSNFNKKVILPYALKVTDSGLTLPKGKDVFVLKVFPEEIKITAVTREVPKLLGYYNGTTYIGDNDKKVTFTVKSSYELPSGLTVALVRNTNPSLGSKKLAPNGVEGTLPEESFDAISKDLSFNLDASNITAKGEYVLPLKYIVKDASGVEQELSNNGVVVNLNVKELVASNDNVEVASKELGTKLNRKGIRISYYGTVYYLGDMIDDDLSSLGYVKEGAFVYFTFPKVRNIKTVVIKTRQGNEMKALSLYAGLSQGNEQIQGSATYSGKGDFIITFKNSVPLIRLALGNFVNKDDATSHWMGITDIQFYEE